MEYISIVVETWILLFRYMKIEIQLSSEKVATEEAASDKVEEGEEEEEEEEEEKKHWKA